MIETTVYLARHFNENPEALAPDWTLGLIVGTNPLDVDDGAAGYIEVYFDEEPAPGPTTMSQVTFRLQHDGVSPVRQGPVVNVRGEYTYEVESTISTLPSILVYNKGTPSSRPAIPDTTRPTTWTRVLKNAVMPFDLDDWDRSDDVTHPWVISPGGYGVQEDKRMVVRVTYLRILVDWESPRPTPLQWRARTDELGGSGVRPARSASTYQATGRARGMV